MMAGMDPAMMGGAPPMDPAMMDPAMMDPAMMGGAPPAEDPAAGGAVTVSLDDLRALMKEMDAGGPEDPDKPKRATNAQIMDEVAALKDSLAAIAAAMGIQLPAGEVGAGADTAPVEPAAGPEDIAAVAAEMGGMDPMSQAMEMGLPPGEMPPDAMPKMAVEAWANTRAARINRSE
jgi:hypothetical protein